MECTTETRDHKGDCSKSQSACLTVDYISKILVGFSVSMSDESDRFTTSQLTEVLDAASPGLRP
jgi:hypothetical protein